MGLLMKKHWLAMTLAVVLITGAAFSFSLFDHGKNDHRYFTGEVEKGPIRVIVNATGTVQPDIMVQVGSQVSGQIKVLYADYNSIVHRGQLLAQIDPSNYQAQLDDAKAALVAAEAHVRSSESDLQNQEANLQSANANLLAARVQRDNDALVYHRNLDLLNSGIIAQNDLDTLKATADSSAAKYEVAKAAVAQAQAAIAASKGALESARADVNQMRADVQKAEINLSYTNIYSPVDGVVVSRNVDIGQTVAASLQAPLLFVIANDLSRMQVNASVDEADIGRISDATEVRFTVDAYPNHSYRGKVSEIRLNAQSTQNVVTYSVIIDVNNDDLRLRPGMTAEITMVVDQKPEVLKLPNAALRYSPAGTQTRSAQGSSGAESSTFAAGPRSSPLSVAAPAAGHEGLAPHPSASQAPENRAPGQLWNPQDKILFPNLPPPPKRRAVVWVLSIEGKPEPRQVVLGITDGSYTEVITGDLKPGDHVIVADEAQADSGMQTQMPLPFGGMMRGGGRGR